MHTMHTSCKFESCNSKLISSLDTPFVNLEMKVMIQYKCTLQVYGIRIVNLAVIIVRATPMCRIWY